MRILATSLIALAAAAGSASAATYGTITGEFVGFGAAHLSNGVRTTGYGESSANGRPAGHMDHDFQNDGTGLAVFLNGKNGLNSFCLEFQNVQSGQHTFTLCDVEDAPDPNAGNPYGTLRADKAHAVLAAARALGWVDHYLQNTGSTTDEQAAAIQMLLWEAVRESAANALDPTTGTFKVITDGGATTELATLLAKANIFLSNGKRLQGLYALTSVNTQDQIVVIPVPAAAGLAGLGLLGLGIRRRR